MPYNIITYTVSSIVVIIIIITSYYISFNTESELIQRLNLIRTYFNI